MKKFNKIFEALSLRERAGATASGLTRRMRAGMPHMVPFEPSPERLSLRLRPIGLALRRSALSRGERAGFAALSLLIAALLPLNVVSQTPPFTLKTSTEVVLVNVAVRDKNDMFIKDLKLQDFTILEDGRKQDIVSLDIENTDSVVTA